MATRPESPLAKRERVLAALRGDAVDRVPVSAWRHFIAEERAPETLAAASLAHLREFDWDWLKVNPRATYYAEAWGNRYDFADYVGVYPRLSGGPIESPADLERIGRVGATAGALGEQLELLRLIGEGCGGVPFIQTVFSPLSVLSFLAGELGDVKLAGAPDEVVLAQLAGLRRLIAENPADVHAALAAISDTLAAYATETLNAGASGIFFAITKLGCASALSREEYAAFGVPYDLRVLRAVAGAPFNTLHTCGSELHFDQVSGYPVQAINWATTAPGNPSLATARGITRRALVGGVDEADVIVRGTPADVTRAAQEAIAETHGRHFLLAPGCAVSPAAPAANLRALRQATEA